MNPLAQITEAEAIAYLEDFRECCEQQAYFHLEGWIPLQLAVDNLQHLAERWCLPELYGQDAIQAEMAFAFMAADLRQEPEEIPLQPAPEPMHRAYCTPQATVDAFLYVARLGDVDYLTEWLERHPLDVPHLRRVWKEKCTSQ
jgi:hypothetical protein